MYANRLDLPSINDPKKSDPEKIDLLIKGMHWNPKKVLNVNEMQEFSESQETHSWFKQKKTVKSAPE